MSKTGKQEPRNDTSSTTRYRSNATRQKKSPPMCAKSVWTNTQFLKEFRRSAQHRQEGHLGIPESLVKRYGGCVARVPHVNNLPVVIFQQIAIFLGRDFISSTGALVCSRWRQALFTLRWGGQRRRSRNIIVNVFGIHLRQRALLSAWRKRREMVARGGGDDRDDIGAAENASAEIGGNPVGASTNGLLRLSTRRVVDRVKTSSSAGAGAPVEPHTMSSHTNPVSSATKLAQSTKTASTRRFGTPFVNLRRKRGHIV